MRRSHLIVIGALALASAATQAQTIFRCGNEYSRVPCPQARPLDDVGDATTAAQRAEARQVALSEKRLAAEMTRDRREQEAALRPAVAGSLGPAPAPAAAASAPTKKHAKKRKKSAAVDADRDFIATVPKAKKAPT
jgi:hypothetical protein